MKGGWGTREGGGLDPFATDLNPGCGNPQPAPVDPPQLSRNGRSMAWVKLGVQLGVQLGCQPGEA